MLVAPWSGELGSPWSKVFKYHPGGRDVGRPVDWKELCSELLEENRKLRAVCRSFWKLINNADKNCSDEVGEALTHEVTFRLQRLAHYYEKRGQRL